MKATDDSQDEALRRALKRKFDHFEAEPSRSVTDRVLGALKNLPLNNSYRFPALILLVLSLGVGGWMANKLWASESVPKVPGLSFVSPDTSTDKAPNTRTKSERIGKKSTLANSKTVSESEPNPNPANIQILENQSAKKTVLPALSPTEEAAEYVVPQSTGALFLLAEPGTERAAIENNTSGSKLQPLAEDRLLIQFSKRMPRKFTSSAERSWPEPGNVQTQMPVEKPVHKPSQITAVISLTPTNTFQQLTVLPQVDVRYQNFRLPSSVSAQTMGYTLRAGVEKNGFQLLVNYSRFQHDIAYEVTQDAYLIEARPTGVPLVIREGVAKTDRLIFQLVGVSLHKKFFIQSPKKIFVHTGASLNHDLTTSQNLGWGTLGIGKSWAVAPHALLSVIPNFGFSLNSLKTNNESFKNRYFQGGLGFELSLGWE